MVSSESESDSGLPDSDNSNNSNLSISNDEIILVGHDNDEELDDHDGIQYHQYEPLPVEESADSTQESSDEEGKHFYVQFLFHCSVFNMTFVYFFLKLLCDLYFIKVYNFNITLL